MGGQGSRKIEGKTEDREGKEKISGQAKKNQGKMEVRGAGRMRERWKAKKELKRNRGKMEVKEGWKKLACEGPGGWKKDGRQRGNEEASGQAV